MAIKSSNLENKHLESLLEVRYIDEVTGVCVLYILHCLCIIYCKLIRSLGVFRLVSKHESSA